MNYLQAGRACRATRADQRRGHLLGVARTLFTEHGFHATGVAQIAAVSGIRVGQIYRDFSGKEEIIAALVEADLADFLDEEGLAAALARGEPAAIRAWIDRLVRVDEPIEECRLMAEIVAEAGRNPRIAEVHHAIDARVRASLAAALAALVPGEDRTGQRARLTDLVMVFGTGLMNRRIADPALDLRGLVEHVDRLIDREIAALRDDAACQDNAL